jgi:UDP-N-acetylglucosamine 2-epimerase (hydrolysing)
MTILPDDAGPSHPTILFLTATRADFGKLKTLISRVRDSSEFRYRIFATGMHMLARYGSTAKEIEKSGFTELFAHINQDGSVTSQMDFVLANTIQGLGHYIREFPPDLIVVHGDRLEALAGAAVGALNNILVAHVEGGELSGTVDELLRHAVSKLSHLHFVANDEARQRLIQMGELPESVFVIGSPDIDIMLSDTLPALPEVHEKYEIGFEPYGILMYHPVTTELARLPAQVDEVIAGVEASALNFVVIFPNNDSGSEIIMRGLQRLRGNPRFRLIPSMRFEYFLSLLRGARVIVGNSSAGVREAPVYGVPTVNVGSRQANRFRTESILNVAEDRAAIVDALSRLPERLPPSRHFGRGQSAELFLQAIAAPSFWATPRQKQFRDLRIARESLV